MTLHGPLPRGYYWEWQFLDKVRAFHDGVTFCEINLNLDRYPDDHNPKVTLGIMVLNVILSQIVIYKSR